MEYLLPVLFLMMQCSHTGALDTLPAPINVSMDSRNFRHELIWAPGPGTPPGTYYRVYSRISRRRPKPKVFKKTSGVLKLKNYPKYKISVMAVYNHSNHSLESLESKALEFNAFQDTRIDPPWLCLVGGDHRLELNISLPKAHKSAKIEDILKFYDAKVTITWQKAGDHRTSSMDMTNSSMVLGNLEAGMNYCVRVHLRIRTNPNTRPSRCVYASTSDPEPSMGPRVLGIAVPLLVLVVVGTVALLVGLHYTGFLCGIQAHVPAVLLMVLSHVYLVTPERTIPDPVYFSPKAAKHDGTGLQDDDEDEEEDEEDADKGEHMYFNRAADLSSDSDSQDAPGGSPGSSCGRACPTVGSGLMAAEWPMPGSHRQPDIRGHSVQGPVTLDKDLHGIQGGAMSQAAWSKEAVSVDERWKEEEEGEGGDVNLFSLTLLKEDNSGNINRCSAIFGGFKEATDHETELDDAPRVALRPRHEPEPHRTPSSLQAQSRTPSDTEEVLLSILGSEQPHRGETERSREGTSCSDLISYGGEMAEEEEPEEEYSSGYMGR
ncbi:unnamed protein product [Arctogadus glacialis]